MRWTYREGQHHARRKEPPVRTEARVRLATGAAAVLASAWCGLDRFDSNANELTATRTRPRALRKHERPVDPPWLDRRSTEDAEREHMEGITVRR